MINQPLNRNALHFLLFGVLFLSGNSIFASTIIIEKHQERIELDSLSVMAEQSKKSIKHSNKAERKEKKEI